MELESASAVEAASGQRGPQSSAAAEARRAAATVLSFVRWGLNGPAYLVDLIAAYCL